MIIHDPYKDILEKFERKEISITEFMRIITHKNKDAVRESHERLLKEIEIAEAKKNSREKLLYGISL